MSAIVGRDCNCEDFPCCGHGITEADLQADQEYLEAERERQWEYCDDLDDIFNDDDEVSL